MILPDVDIGRYCRIRNASHRPLLLDHGGHHDRLLIPRPIGRAGFHVTEGGVTLVSPEMLGQEINYLR